MFSAIRTAVAATFLFLCPVTMAKELTAEEKAQIIKETAEAVKPQLPIQLDEYTTVYAILAKTDRLLYVINLAVGENDVEEGMQQQFKQVFVQNLCGNDSVRTKFLDAGIGIEAVYKYNNGAVAANFLVTKESCVE